MDTADQTSLHKHTTASYNSVYYRFTPATTASYVFSTCNTANFDIKIIVSTTCDPTLGFITCNDDDAGCSGYTSITPAAILTAGTPYFVIIGGCVCVRGYAWNLHADASHHSHTRPVLPHTTHSYSRNDAAGSGTITITASFPTQAPTVATNSPTQSQTRQPTEAPTRSPTQESTTRSPTQSPTYVF